MVRKTVVEGQFYPADKKGLLEQLDDMIPAGEKKVDAIGAVMPHAGYVCSGYVAGETYGRLKPGDTYIILGPNHTGYGKRFAACGESWMTPLGEVGVDNDLLEGIMNKTGLISMDITAHVFEHSIEVQLPFIQKISPEAKIVPLTVRHGTFEEYREVAEAITSAVEGQSKKVVVIASSDMTHYEKREIAREKDKKAIQAVLDLDAKRLLDVVERENITMCGYIPTVIMLLSACGMGAKKSELVKYTDSGDVTGDTLQVVGYAGILVY